MSPRSEGLFNEEYKKLNKAQKEAVDTIDGPVMVVAGPGTGKTQILALRIANILHKTDIKADGILCLTFTNSGVEAMRERLIRYIGEAGEQVNIFTFHSFGMKVIVQHFKVLGLPAAPKLLEDTDRAILFDQILQENQWEYLRPRSDRMRYFDDLKSLISILKRERITAKDFEKAVKKEIRSLRNAESSISTRGESKGEIKKEVLKEIEGLERSSEVVQFITLYETAKKEKNLLDYDDVLESLVEIVEKSDEVAALLREIFLYILIDEHQDSSRVQNEFLTRVWAEVERPDIFVVGDDRQLIYGFSGASIEYFANFKKTFPDAKLITLLDNYRSTQIILDASHALLKSVMSTEKLLSHKEETHSVRLVEAETPEEEISAAAKDIKDKIKKGTDPSECAILVPKNRQILPALQTLQGMEVPIYTHEAINLFDQDGARSMLRVLKIITEGDNVSLALSFFDKTSDIEPLESSKFIAQEYMRDFSFDKLLNKPPELFSSTNQVHKWIAKLVKWKKDSEKNDLKSFVQIVGKELFSESEQSNQLVSIQEILDTFLEILAKEEEKNSEVTLPEFTAYLGRLESYGECIPVVSSRKEGVRVLTMHRSKGLEFDYVWIAHMDEKSLAGGKKTGFTLPESIAKHIEERDVDTIKRKLYVAITRAKVFCTLSYSLESQSGVERELARVIADLPAEVFEKVEAAKVLKKSSTKEADFSALIKLVKEKYQKRYVSASLLNNFFECPWKWYFRNILQLPGPESESLVFGNKVHAAIDQILKSRKEIIPPEKDVAKVVSGWIKNRLKDISPDRENEQPVSFKDDRFPYFSIYGRIDLIEKLDSGSVRVTDFKTGSVRKKSEIEKRDEEGRLSNLIRQLAMYSYLLQGTPKWNNVKVAESRLEFLEAKNPKEYLYSHFVSKEEIALLVKDISDYDHLVKTGEWVNRPCNYNSYGKNTECEYCKMAEVYN